MTASSALIILVLAASEPRWGLKFTAPDGCIGPAELAERIEQRVGRALFGAKADVRIEGHLTAERGATKWRARLTLVDSDGTVKGSREVTSSEMSCRSIDEPLALVAAVMIDPAAALRGNAPTPTEPAAEPVPVPPPPQLNPPPALPTPRIVPREEWPSYLVVDRTGIWQNGRTVDRGTFYRMVGRSDLDSSYEARLITKGLLYTFGSLGVVTGATLMLVQLTNASCTDYAGSPSSPGDCVQKSNWPLLSGAITAAISVAAIVIAAVLHSEPTGLDEDVMLAETYNAKLQAPAMPATAMRF